MRSPEADTLRDRNFHYGRTCDLTVTGDSRIGLGHMRIVFFVYGVCSTVAVVLTSLERCLRPARVALRPMKEEVYNERLDSKLDDHSRQLNQILHELTLLKRSY